MNKLRWGILSTAHIAREKVIPGIQKADRCDVVAIASRDTDQARRVADQLGIPKAHGSYQALLAGPEIDAGYTPPPTHLVDRRSRARGLGSHRSAPGGAELVLLLQRRRGEHPEHPRVRGRRPDGYRLLLGEPVPDAVRGGAGPRRGLGDA